MHCTCVRHTDIPHTSTLFADYLYHPDRTARFYRHPYRDLDAYKAAAAEVNLSPERRAALVAALRIQNPGSPNLERLAQPDTVAVITGQQVGLFSGPSYTIYKLLHAARLAEWLTANGVPAVPVFWLATEDHDFAEVNHVWVFDAEHRPVKLEMKRSASTQPVGDVTLSDPPIRELRAALHGFPFGEEVTDLIEETYRAGSTMGKAFGEFLRQILNKYDVLQVDPMLPEFRELAAPAMRAAVEAAPELSAAILARNRELVDAGYHAQVHVEEQTSLFFLLENGKRLALRRNGNEYSLNGRRFSSAELVDRAASLSPNALLRPVVADSMIPTVAAIGGPAELAYLAQSEVIYRSLLKRMPVAVPRSGFTILDGHSQKLMDRYALNLQSFFHGEESLRERISGKLVPPALTGAMQATQDNVQRAVEKLRMELVSFDPTLAKALERSGRKILYQLGKVERKVGREAMLRDTFAARDASSLYGLIFPERTLQERVYSILPFLARHGFELIDQIHQTIELECADHRVMVI